MTTTTQPADRLTFDRFNVRTWLGLGLVAIGVAMFFLAESLIVPYIHVTLISNDTLNSMFRRQLALLGVAAVLLVLLYLIFPEKFRAYARLGDHSAHPQPVKWLGIKATDTWGRVGLTFAGIVSIGTAAFMVIGGLHGDLSILNSRWIGLALLLSVTNAFIEETITRFGVVVSLDGVIPPRFVAVASALVFGIPHWFGVPGGPIGSLMAGFLGWLLAKSMIETRGVFWAWFVHFIQDVIIFLVMASVILA